MKIGWRIGVLTGLPIVLLLIVLATAWLNGRTLALKLESSSSALRTGLNTKAYRDRVTAAQIAIGTFLWQPSEVSQRNVDAAKMAALAAFQVLADDAGRADLPNGIELRNAMSALGRAIDAVIWAQTRLGFEGLPGLGASVDAAGVGLEGAIADNLDPSDPLGFAIMQGSQELRQIQFKAAKQPDAALLDLFRTKAETAQRGIAASYIGPAKKRQLGDALRDYAAAFETWWSGAEMLDSSAAVARDEVSLVQGLADGLVLASSDVVISAGRAVAEAERGALHLMLATIAIGILVSSGLGLLIGLDISRPIRALARDLTRLAGGDLSVSSKEVVGRDEIARVARTVAIFRDMLVERRQLTAQQDDASRRAGTRAATVDELVQSYETVSQAVLSEIGAASIVLARTSANLTGCADRVSATALSANAAADSGVHSIVGVSEAAQRLGGSIGEIMAQTSASSAVARAALDEAERTVRAMSELARFTRRIDEVVTFIQSIASRTNLLALNATIEAARAGEAGRGFAVVASEVKSLAAQTAQATKDISQQIREIQSASGGAVAAIEGVNRTIHEMAHSTTIVETAVGEQSRVVALIAEGMQRARNEAARGAAEIESVDTAAAATRQAADEVGALAERLGRQASTLLADATGFLQQVKAA